MPTKAKKKAKSAGLKRARAPQRVSAVKSGGAAKGAGAARGIERDLLARLKAGAVICAEGYVFELERRGYLQAGAFVPEVLFEHPEVVEQLHLDFVHAGSDVTEALTYYVHREKLRVIGREKDLAAMNRIALRIARKVARRTGTLFAGDLCNTNIYDPNDAKALKEVERIFDEQVGWAVEAGVDFFVAETFAWAGEAELALKAIQRQSKAPAVVTFAMHQEAILRDGLTPAEACRRLEQAGADVVGLNCHRGPATMMPMIRDIRAAVKCHVAALPVPYRTTPQQPSFMALTDPCCDNRRAFPVGLDPFLATRAEIFDFGREAFALGARYLGVCCGAGPHHIRALAESVGRHPPASRYSVDMSRHAYFGTDRMIRRIQTEYRDKA
ncbi:MAG TPA: homocysteine S-methyltransferase family protein [Steroidobacteraceae bacterium]|nr:homocysteine S-methyltransferase family protein [Gammaproteobacteria bacterium]HEV2284670.1 homocysteine S-methyltransferase family protein [Steroidobacteraceae bacterium]